MGSFFRTSKYQQKADQKAFMIRNGNILLGKLIATSNGKYNPIRSFSAKELNRATNNYHNLVTWGVGYTLYRGFLLDRPISVMKFVDDPYYRPHEICFNNIVFASEMRHKNVLKLIGCCLELPIPVLVFESFENGTLHDRLKSRSHCEPLLLKHRLKIAMEMASVMAYLHMGFSRPIVFRDLTSQHILFCEESVPKLFNFSLSESIPEGETHICDEVRGTSRMIAPEYVRTGLFNEKCDVYSFGVLLFELLTGETPSRLAMRLEIIYDKDWVDCIKKYIVKHGLERIVDPRIVGYELREQQLRASVELSFKCFSELEEDRPKMIDVAKQLRQMYQSI